MRKHRLKQDTTSGPQTAAPATPRAMPTAGVGPAAALPVLDDEPPAAGASLLSRLRLSGGLPAERWAVLAIVAVLWFANYLHYADFGIYEDDWYYFPSAYGITFTDLMRLRTGQSLFQGRPLQVIIQALVAGMGAAVNSIPLLYFITFLTSAAKVLLGYAVLRLRFERPLATLAAILFAISPLTTIRQSLNNELSIAPAFAFAFAGILLFARGRWVGAYLLAVLSMLTYEPMFFIFAAAPLFLPGGVSVRNWAGLTRHAILTGLLFCGIFYLRLHTGDTRSGGVAADLSTLGRMAWFDVHFSLSTATSYLYGVYVGVRHATLEGYLYTAAILAPICGAAIRALARESSDERRSTGRRSAAAGVAIGLVLVLLGFGLVYYQMDGHLRYPLSGRDTRFAGASSFGSSLLVVSAFSLVLAATRAVLVRGLAIAAFLVFWCGTSLYSFVIQDDFLAVWRHDRDLLRQSIMLTPDADEQTTILIQRQPIAEPLFPGNRRAPSVGSQSHGLEVALESMLQYRHPRRIVCVESGRWKEALSAGRDGLLHWTEPVTRTWETPFRPGKLIFLKEVDGEVLVRDDTQVIAAGQPLIQVLQRAGTSETLWAEIMRVPIVEKLFGRVPASAFLLNTTSAGGNERNPAFQ